MPADIVPPCTVPSWLAAAGRFELSAAKTAEYLSATLDMSAVDALLMDPADNLPSICVNTFFVTLNFTTGSSMCTCLVVV